MAICGATLMTFQQAMRVNETATLSVETNDSLRTAMDLMVRDFIQVGQGLPAGKSIPLPSGVGAVAVVRPSPPNQNYTLPFPATQEVLSAVTPGAALGANVPGTASLHRHGDGGLHRQPLRPGHLQPGRRRVVDDGEQPDRDRHQ